VREGRRWRGDLTGEGKKERDLKTKWIYPPAGSEKERERVLERCFFFFCPAQKKYSGFKLERDTTARDVWVGWQGVSW